MTQNNLRKTNALGERNALDSDIPVSHVLIGLNDSAERIRLEKLYTRSLDL